MTARGYTPLTVTRKLKSAEEIKKQMEEQAKMKRAARAAKEDGDAGWDPQVCQPATAQFRRTTSTGDWGLGLRRNSSAPSVGSLGPRVLNERVSSGEKDRSSHRR